MRNLKKFLALVMAMVMAFSLMLSASAASQYDQVKAWDDKDQVDAAFVEAVDVLSGMKIYQGDSRGFAPGDTITRAEVAALIYRAATGDVNDTRSGLYANYGNFKDVNEGDWFAGYVGYCANAGYIKGHEGYFNPYGKVTGYEVLAMILRAVGYDKNHEFEGATWQTNVSALATRLEVVNQVKTTHYGNTLHLASRRDVVASLLFETIAKVPTVTYTPALGYETDKFTEDNLSSLGAKIFGLKDQIGIVVGNQDTGESATRVNWAAKDMPAHVAYFHQTKNYNENSKATNTDLEKTTETVQIDAKTGIEMFGHKVKVWYGGSGSVKDTYALYDRAVKTALVTASDVVLSNAAGNGDLGAKAAAAGFNVDLKQSKAVFNQNFGVSGSIARISAAGGAGESDYTSNGAWANVGSGADTAALDYNGQATGVRSHAGRGYQDSQAFPLYLLISNSSNNQVDMVIAVDTVVSKVTQVNDYTRFPAVTVPLHDQSGTAKSWFNDKDADMIDQKALTATSTKNLGDGVVGVAIIGTNTFDVNNVCTVSSTALTREAQGFTPAAGSVGSATAAFGNPSTTTNYFYRLSKPTKTIEGTVTGYTHNATTTAEATSGSVTINGQKVERSLLATTIVGYSSVQDSLNPGGLGWPRGLAPAAYGNNVGLSPDTGNYGEYRLYLDEEGKYIWAEPIRSSDFIYGTYVDYTTPYGSSSYEYTMIGVDMEGKQVKRVVTGLNGASMTAAMYGTVAVTPQTDELNVPFRDNGATASTGAVTANLYVGFNISDKGALTNITTAGGSLPGSNVVRGDNVFAAGATVTSDDAKLGMASVGTGANMKYFTNNTKFIVVDGAGTDTQKVEVYNGLTEFLDGANRVTIAYEEADCATRAAKDAAPTHGWATKYLHSDAGADLKQMIYFTQSPFTYASTTGRGNQIDTVIIPKAALDYSGRSNLVYLGRNVADSVTYLDANNTPANAAYLYTMYQDGEAKQYWVDNTANGVLTTAGRNDHFYVLDDTGRTMPDGTAIYTTGAPRTETKDGGNGRPNPATSIAGGYQPILDRTTYWAATYDAQTAKIGDNTTGATASDSTFGAFDVSNAKVVNLNAITSPETTPGVSNDGYVWSTITDLRSLNAAASAADSYNTNLPKVAVVTDDANPMVVTTIYVCWDQTSVL